MPSCGKKHKCATPEKGSRKYIFYTETNNRGQQLSPVVLLCQSLQEGRLSCAKTASAAAHAAGGFAAAKAAEGGGTVVVGIHGNGQQAFATLTGSAVICVVSAAVVSPAPSSLIFDKKEQALKESAKQPTNPSRSHCFMGITPGKSLYKLYNSWIKIGLNAKKNFTISLPNPVESAGERREVRKNQTKCPRNR